MHVQRDATKLPPNTAACMGAFDGLHRGHQALIERARRHAENVALVTFDPHPTAVLAPARTPQLLHAPVQRERVAEALGIDHLVLLPFDVEMSRQAPDEFARTYFAEGLSPSAVVVGADFRFGARRAGTAQSLAERLGSNNIDVEIVDLLPMDTGEKVSSSDIRRALANGNVQRAGTLLGRWHSVAGTVVHGAKRGRTLGFPTANLDPIGGTVPPIGIYASVLTVWDPDVSAPDLHGAVLPSVTSIGHNPTFTAAGAPLTVETHVLDLDLEERLYGLRVEVAFVKRLRDEQTFEGADALIEQMRRDVDAARATLDPTTLAHTLVPPSARRKATP